MFSELISPPSQLLGLKPVLGLSGKLMRSDTLIVSTRYLNLDMSQGEFVVHFAGRSTLHSKLVLISSKVKVDSILYLKIIMYPNLIPF